MARPPALRFLVPYYLAQAAMLATYPLLTSRWMAGDGHDYSRLTDRDDLSSKERYTFILLTGGLVLKWWKRQSLDAFVAEALFFSQLALGVLVLYLDSRVFAYLLLAQIVAWLLFRQPVYAGPSSFEELTPASFPELVGEAAARDAAPGWWVVEVWAPWSPQSVALAPVAAELSLAYGGDAAGGRLRWGRVNAEAWPALAEQLGVPVRGSEGINLPVFLLYQGGKEVDRMPRSQAGSWLFGQLLRRHIVEGLKLEERAAEPTAKATAGNGKARRR